MTMFLWVTCPCCGHKFDHINRGEATDNMQFACPECDEYLAADTQWNGRYDVYPMYRKRDDTQ